LPSNVCGASNIFAAIGGVGVTGELAARYALSTECKVYDVFLASATPFIRHSISAGSPSLSQAQMLYTSCFPHLSHPN